METMQFSFVYDRKEKITMAKYTVFCNLKKISIFMNILCTCLILIAISAYYRQGKFIPIQFIALAIIWFARDIFLPIFFAIIFRLQKDPYFDKTLFYTISNNYIVLKSDDFEFKKNWESFSKAFSFKNGYFLMGRGVSFWFPHYAIDEEQRFRDVIKDKLGKIEEYNF